ncbi:MAG: Hsp70 family protein, partial [Candidatus Dormiibacterota bacterium]
PPVGLDLRVRRTAFDAMIAPELDLVFVAIAEALEKANVTAAQVDRVLLTGGSSQIPAFRARLVEHFGEERLEGRDAFTAVAHGLGAYARQTWLAAA